MRGVFYRGVAQWDQISFDTLSVLKIASNIKNYISIDLKSLKIPHIYRIFVFSTRSIYVYMLRLLQNTSKRRHLEPLKKTVYKSS